MTVSIKTIADGLTPSLSHFLKTNPFFDGSMIRCSRGNCVQEMGVSFESECKMC